MADNTQKYEDNVPGKFYVDKQCILCSLCHELAPANFKESEAGDHDHVFKQPETPDEEKLCIEAMGQCPVEAIGNDAEESGSSGRDRRKFPRIDARIQVQFRSGPEFVACYSENISKGGIYLQTEVPPDPNAELEVVLSMPQNLETTGSREFRLRGRIVRLMSFSENRRSVHKVAVQFIDISPQEQSQLDLLYDELVKTHPIS